MTGPSPASQDLALGDPAGRSRRWRDWRVWLGFVISAVCIWLTARGVPLDEVGGAMARADLVVLLVLSVPAYVFSTWLRALRWRHLTNPIAPIDRGTLFRAQALGFMVNNLVPLRVGELVRSWYLAREARQPAAAILGTVVLERVLDVVTVLALAIAALSLVTSGGGEDSDLLEQGSRYLLPVAMLPVLALAALRFAPELIYAVTRWTLRPLPERIGEGVESGLRRFSEGLGALTGGSHLFWIGFHSVVIWLVASTLPIVAAVLAFDLDLGGPLQTLIACWVLLGATGVAVALPSAPGFIGTYQLAYKAVLVRFGVEPATAFAVGMLVWAVFWASLTLQGLVALRGRRARLADLAAEPGEAPLADLAVEPGKDPLANRR